MYDAGRILRVHAFRSWMRLVSALYAASSLLVAQTSRSPGVR